MPAGATLSEVSVVKRHFLSINRERLRRAQSSLRPRQRNFLDVLPLLFHINNPLLPGYISDATPFGISDYSPDKRTQEAAKRIHKAFIHKRKALPRYDILSIFLMGSSGTIAHSQKSDFDIWICHHTHLSTTALAELHTKAHDIEKWALSLELEVHFFFMDADSFKAGQKNVLSEEGSGSAQHYILLEEFYRTSLLLAGRYPAWWLVPPTEESNYDHYLSTLKKNGAVRETEYVDFGAIPQIPAEEFFGAAVWQLFKGIDAPYKSVLKLLLMEVYAYQHPASDLLCQRFKRAIYTGEINLNQLDPYVMLYHKIAEHLQEKNELERLDLFRRCFYFKVGEKLSALHMAHQNNWRRDLMKTLVESWEWDNAYLATLDTRTHWKISRVLRERKILTAELTQSYKFLSDFAHNHAQLTSINQQDLNILGRKLYAAFEKKPGKIEVVNCGISQHLDENYITFHQAVETNYQDNWSVHTAPLHQVEAGSSSVIKRSASIVELIAWCHFNELIDNGTVIALHTESSTLTIRETRSVLACLQRLFPSHKIAETNMACFSTPSKTTKVALFVNLGIEPMAMQAKLGIHYTSNKTDALSYGGIGENLALTFDVITLTNWQEVLTRRYTGLNGIIKYLGDYIQETPPSKGTPAPISVFCFSSAHSSTISKRIEELFQDVITCFYRSPHAKTMQYIMAAEHMHYIFRVENDTLHHKRMETYQDLLHHLSIEHTSYSPMMIDHNVLRDTPLPIISKLNKPDAIQLFYQTEGTHTDIYVTDEKGSLYYQHILSTDSTALINQFTLFFDSIAKHGAFPPRETPKKPDSPPETMEVHQLTRDHAGHFILAKSDISARGRIRNYFDIQVTIDKGPDANLEFTINCGNTRFTSEKYGNNLFTEVAQHVIKHRQGGSNYPIYITNIELPQKTNSNGPQYRQTISFLNHKKIIENKLNDVLDTIDKTPAQHQLPNTRRNQTPIS